jgi:hypothetical protein
VQTTATLIAVVAFACWLTVAVSWLQLLGHRREGVSLTRLLFSGLAAFDASNFRESGRPIQRRMIRAFLGFFACVFAGVALGVVAAQP